MCACVCVHAQLPKPGLQTAIKQDAPLFLTKPGASLTVLEHTDEGDNGQQNHVAHSFLVHVASGSAEGTGLALAL